MKLRIRIATTLRSSGLTQNDSVRGAATPTSFNGRKGSGAPSIGRLRAALAVLALAIAAFAIAAVPALAAPPSATAPVVSEVSYTTAHVTSEVAPLGSPSFFYKFEVSTNGTSNWTPKAEGFKFGNVKTTIPADLSGLKDGTEYFVRVSVSNFAEPPEVGVSPAPNPSFTTLAASPPTIPGAVAASAVFSNSAKGTAEVNRPTASDNVTCNFEYVTDAEFIGNPPGERFAGATVRPCAENPIEAAGTKEVSAPLGCANPMTEAGNCLTPSTTYHLRLVAENAGGAVTKDAATFTTAAKVTSPPIVIAADNATEVSKRTAQASGEIERPAGADPALNVECRFEYVTDAHFTAEGFAGAEQAPCTQNPVTSTGPGFSAVAAHVSAELSGLTPVTTYHLRLTAENGAGAVSKEAATTFTTIAVVHPTLTVDSITEVGYTSFRVTGTADPGNQGVYPFFEFSPVGKEEWAGNPIGRFAPVEAGSPAEQVSWNFPNDGDSPPLKPGTTYEVRVHGQDLEEGNQYVSAASDFTTKGTSTPPSGTFSVSGITGTSVHFSGTVDTHAPAGPLPDEAKPAYKTEWRIECTPECKDANENVIGGTVEAEEGSKAFSVDAKRLEPKTHYKEVKMIVHNTLATVETPVQSFDTSVIPPTVKAALGNSDGKGGYTLQGVVNPNNDVITACNFEWGPNSAEYTFSAPCSPLPSEGSKSISVEAHLTGLTPGATYHDKLVVTYGAGSKADGGDQSFVPTLSPAENCGNEQRRTENSSLALPECRAYELVTPMGKEGFAATLETFDGGARVAFKSQAPNIAKSGQNNGLSNRYVAARTANGWETIPDLNGSSGSLRDAPSYVDSTNFLQVTFETYSSDLLSSIWGLHRQGDPGYAGSPLIQVRNPDGLFTLLGSTTHPFGGYPQLATSADLSHVLFWTNTEFSSSWGPGVYEYVGTGMDQPRRVDLDNFGSPVSTCIGGGTPFAGSALNRSISANGSRIVNYVFGHCGGTNPPANELWARIDGTTSVDVSASHCTRPDCNSPSDATFAAATPDGSRIFFTTTQQLVNGDIDEANDIYYCDLPSGDPAPAAGKANPCSGFGQISVAETGAAEVEEVLTTSEDGSTVLFTAKGVLAANEDALKEQAIAGGNNLYVWHQDAAHPDGQTWFVGRLASDDINTGSQHAQATPDGHYAVFTTASQLVETDTDSSRDVYRVDAETGELIRISTNVFGVAGNGPFDAETSSPTERHPTTTISADGQKILFTTAEALSPADGNGEPDVYLWTPARVSLISTGASGSAPREVSGTFLNIKAAIDPSGEDIYFESPQQLTPADGDGSTDVYDARIGGGFSFAPSPVCAGETCQPGASNPPASGPPGSRSTGPGNPIPPKPCPKGKVVKGGKCVKKHKGKHHKKKSHQKHHGKKTGQKQGGGK